MKAAAPVTALSDFVIKLFSFVQPLEQQQQQQQQQQEQQQEQQQLLQQAAD
jgi:hypothetical protein